MATTSNPVNFSDGTPKTEGTNSETMLSTPADETGGASIDQDIYKYAAAKQKYSQSKAEARKSRMESLRRSDSVKDIALRVFADAPKTRLAQMMDFVREKVTDLLEYTGITDEEDLFDEGMPVWPAEFVMTQDGDPIGRSLAHRMYVMLTEPGSCKMAMYCTVFIFAIIILSLMIFVIETEPALRQWPEACRVRRPLDNKYVCEMVDYDNETLVDYRATFNEFCSDNECVTEQHSVFFGLECLCVGFFTIEYLLKLFTCWMEPDHVEKKQTAETGHHFEHETLKYPKRVFYFFFDILNLIDFIGVFSFYMQFFSDAAKLTFIRILRLSRIFRVLRVGRLPFTSEATANGMLMVGQVVSSSMFSLRIVSICVLFFMVLMGALMYQAEAGSMDYASGRYMVDDIDAGTQRVTPYTSISTCFWYVLVTFVTVGYGDMYPTTGFGRMIGVFTMVIGVCLLAMPIAIIGGTYTTHYERMVHTMRMRQMQRDEALGIVKKYILIRWEIEEKEERKKKRDAEKAQQLAKYEEGIIPEDEMIKFNVFTQDANTTKLTKSSQDVSLFEGNEVTDEQEIVDAKGRRLSVTQSIMVGTTSVDGTTGVVESQGNRVSSVLVANIVIEDTYLDTLLKQYSFRRWYHWYEEAVKLDQVSMFKINRLLDEKLELIGAPKGGPSPAPTVQPTVDAPMATDQAVAVGALQKDNAQLKQQLSQMQAQMNSVEETLTEMMQVMKGMAQGIGPPEPPVSVTES